MYSSITFQISSPDEPNTLPAPAFNVVARRKRSTLNLHLTMLLPEAGLITTPPTKDPLAKDLENMEVAIQQARLGLKEGGIPIGGALVSEVRIDVH